MVRSCSFHNDISPSFSECVHARKRVKIYGMVMSTGLPDGHCWHTALHA